MNRTNPRKPEAPAFVTNDQRALPVQIPCIGDPT